MSVARPTLAATLAFLALMCLLAMLGGCAAPAEVRFDRDPNVDLRRYQTFAFSDPAANGRSPYGTILGGRLYNATRERLEEEGFVYRELDPDLRVRLLVGPGQPAPMLLASSAAVASDGYSLADAGGMAAARHRLVAVEISDARRGALLWRGVAEQPAGEPPARNPWPAIGSAMDDILGALPTRTAR